MIRESLSLSCEEGDGDGKGSRVPRQRETTENACFSFFPVNKLGDADAREGVLKFLLILMKAINIVRNLYFR